MNFYQSSVALLWTTALRASGLTSPRGRRSLPVHGAAWSASLADEGRLAGAGRFLARHRVAHVSAGDAPRCPERSIPAAD
jgi:hypothetical protein